MRCDRCLVPMVKRVGDRMFPDFALGSFLVEGIEWEECVACDVQWYGIAAASKIDDARKREGLRHEV